MLLQVLVTEGAAHERDPFDHPSTELNLGWKRVVLSGTVLEVGIVENVLASDSSPDFGVHFGLRHRF